MSHQRKSHSFAICSIAINACCISARGRFDHYFGDDRFRSTAKRPQAECISQTFVPAPCPRPRPKLSCELPAPSSQLPAPGMKGRRWPRGRWRWHRNHCTGKQCFALVPGMLLAGLTLKKQQKATALKPAAHPWSAKHGGDGLPLGKVGRSVRGVDVQCEKYRAIGLLTQPTHQPIFPSQPVLARSVQSGPAPLTITSFTSRWCSTLKGN